MTWNHIELSDHFGHGITADGDNFVEMDIDGWNDDEDFSDLDSIVTVGAVIEERSYRIYVKYNSEAAKSNVTVKRLIEEAKKAVEEEAKHYLKY